LSADTRPVAAGQPAAASSHARLLCH